MRILQILLSPRIGGAESAAGSLESSWREHGHESKIAYLDARGTAPLRRLRHIVREVRAFRPDVIVSHSALPNLYTRVAVRKASTPVVCVLHSATRDLDDKTLRFAERVLRHRAAAIVAVSEAQVDEYRSHFPDQVLDLVPNGIGLRFAPSPTPPATLDVISVGRVVHQKDPLTWAEIAKQAVARDGRLRFKWVGPTGIDSTYSELEDQLRADSGPVRFVGPTNDVSDSLGHARIMLHTAHREAHSVALLEAAASGLPIVCTNDVGSGLPGWIVREEFRAGDSESGLAALQRVLDELGSFEDRARLVAARVVQEFGIQACAERYLQIFARVV